jgi:hypothetical protein
VGCSLLVIRFSDASTTKLTHADASTRRVPLEHRFGREYHGKIGQGRGQALMTLFGEVSGWAEASRLTEGLIDACIVH